MLTQLDALERHNELGCGEDRYNPAVRAELLWMSAASIDCYLEPIGMRARHANDRFHLTDSDDAGGSHHTHSTG